MWRWIDGPAGNIVASSKRSSQTSQTQEVLGYSEWFFCDDLLMFFQISDQSGAGSRIPSQLVGAFPTWVRNCASRRPQGSQENPNPSQVNLGNKKKMKVPQQVGDVLPYNKNSGSQPSSQTSLSNISHLPILKLLSPMWHGPNDKSPQCKYQRSNRKKVWPPGRPKVCEFWCSTAVRAGVSPKKNDISTRAPKKGGEGRGNGWPCGHEGMLVVNSGSRWLLYGLGNFGF